MTTASVIPEAANRQAVAAGIVGRKPAEIMP
jgi:hypothetical protein